MKAADKIRNLDDLRGICAAARGDGRRIVFTNGCFDLLHVGHVRYLEAAREHGDLLIVGVNSDRSVRKIKGPLRPVTGERERAELVAALHCVDHVILFETPDPLYLIQLLEPDVLVKGADWSLEHIVGAAPVMEKGGEVVRIPLTPQSSTTSIIERIVERFGGVRLGSDGQDPG